MARRKYSPKAKPSVEYVVPTYRTDIGWTSPTVYADGAVVAGPGAGEIPEESYVFGGYLRHVYWGANLPVATIYALSHQRKDELAPTVLSESWAEKKFRAGELHRFGSYLWSGFGAPEPLYLKFRRTMLSEGERIEFYRQPMVTKALVDGIMSMKVFFKRV